MTGVGVALILSIDPNLDLSLAVHLQRNFSAGVESACVSLPINRGPEIPACVRYSQIACGIAMI